MLLEKSFFEREAPEVARDLLGRELLRRMPGGEERVVRVVEAEAYLAEADEAAHAVRGRKQALEALRLGPGTIYIHPMRQYVGMDLVAVGGSVLIRAAELVRGVVEGRMDGPGKLCRALGIGREMHGQSVLDEGCSLRVAAGKRVGRNDVMVGNRVGVMRSVTLPLRFWVRGSRFVSR